MTNAEKNYFVSNAEFARDYLMEQSETLPTRKERNTAYNHALAIVQLINAVNSLYNRNLHLCGKLGEADKLIRDLKEGEFKTYLDANIELIKKSLIELIQAYPDIDY